jgi:trk system potassium uptake protein TrkH
VNYAIVFRILGIIFIIESLFMIPPLLVSIGLNDGAQMSFLMTIVILMLSFIAIRKFVNTKNLRVTPKDGLYIVSISWISASIFGALPLYFSKSYPSYVDSLFEIVSGFTTTGASVCENPEIVPKSIILWRSMTHWIGGMGILVFTLILLPKLGIGAYQIFKAETPGPIAGKIESKMTDTAKRLYIIYMVITLILFVLLVLGRMPVFDAVVHTLGVVGTGGFSSKSNSVEYYANSSRYIPYVMSFFMIFCATNFYMYNHLYKGRFRNILEDEEFRAYYILLFVSTVLVSLNLYYSGVFDMRDSVMHAFFQTTSISSTSGFATTDYDLWPTFSKYILFILMCIGGSAGSTGGGIKAIRMVVLLKLIKREIKRVLHPHAVIPIQINGRIIRDEVVTGIYGFLGIYTIIMIASATIISLSGVDFLSALSTAATLLSNVGPGFGAVGPTRNFLFYNKFFKLFFCLLMLLGRLEFFTLLALIAPSKIRRKPNAANAV